MKTEVQECFPNYSCGSVGGGMGCRVRGGVAMFPWLVVLPPKGTRGVATLAH